MRFDKEELMKDVLSRVDWMIENTKRKLEQIEKDRESLVCRVNKITPELIIEHLKMPENEKVYAIIASLAKNLGELDRLNQLMCEIVNFKDRDFDLNKAIMESSNAKEMNMGDDVSMELHRLLFADKVDSLTLMEKYDAEQFLYTIRREITRFINDVSDLNGAFRFLAYKRDIGGIVIGDFENKRDSYLATYIPSKSVFWMVYETLLDNEDVMEEGVALFNKVKNEFASTGRPVKFSEEEQLNE